MNLGDISEWVAKSDLIVKIPVLLFAITIHEYSHGKAAYSLGDPTPKLAGRLTLNPISHIDLFGTIIMPVLLFLLTDGRMVFGYAKPVPINPYYFKNPKKGMALSAMAGPGVNMLMAITFSFLLRVVMSGLEGKVPDPYWGWFAAPLSFMFFYGILMNVVLAVLNMIPIPPLDGSRVMFWLLPERQAQAYYRLEPYGMFILLFLIMFGVLGKIITPIIRPILMLLLGESVF
jgi:Zn-dependent protease